MNLIYYIRSGKTLPMLTTSFEVSENIMEIVAKYFEMPIDNFITKSKKRELVVPRQFMHFFLKEKTKLSLQSIGDMTRRNHATVLHSIKIINRLVGVDKEVTKYYTELRKLIG